MKKESKDVNTSWWRQMLRKRWFWPTIYLTLAALLLTLIITFQNSDKTGPEEDDRALEVSDHFVPVTETGEEPVEPVAKQVESIQMPVPQNSEVEIVTKYYDYGASEEEQEQALILFENHYYQSTGIDIAAKDGEAFDVLASLSGVVTTVKEDPILGNVIILSHEDDVETFYASLGEINVQEGDEVKQGEVIGQAGKSLIGKDHGNHLHFEIRKNNETFNPEKYFNAPVSQLVKTDDANDEDSDDEESNE